ncbi:MAG: hypothetical protein HYZ15_00250 [Sphingobacteriales bacterium]|nr:hypothetical protein [Sphingobacteriales bacterium]
MPVKRQITEPDGVFFITVTCYKWIPLFAITNGYDLVYKWFDHLKTKGHYVSGYVIMPNHLHALIAFRNTAQSVNTIVGNGKRFMAYDIVKRLQVRKEESLLHQLEIAVEAKDRERKKKHEIWEDSFEWKECRTTSFMRQKVEYMHNNPVRGKWKLAGAVHEYEHSSAKYYLAGMQGRYPVLDFCEIADLDLTKPL